MTSRSTACTSRRAPSRTRPTSSSTKQFNVWIADTGNNRLLKFDEQGNFLQEFGTAEDDGKLNAPEGIYISERDEIWVADRGNGRIVQFAQDGSFVKALGKPRSRLLEEDQVYQPNKLVIDRRGYIYVLNGGGDYRGIFLLDCEGEFRGFFGANRLKFDVARLLHPHLHHRGPEEADLQGAAHPPRQRLRRPAGLHLHRLARSPRRTRSRSSTPSATTSTPPPRRSSGSTSGGGTRSSTRSSWTSPWTSRGSSPPWTSTAGGSTSTTSRPTCSPSSAGGAPSGARSSCPRASPWGAEGKIYVLDANRNNVQIFRPTEFAGLLHDGSQALLRRQVRRRLQDLGGGAAPQQLLRAGPHRPGQVPTSSAATTTPP